MRGTRARHGPAALDAETASRTDPGWIIIALGVALLLVVPATAHAQIELVGESIGSVRVDSPASSLAAEAGAAITLGAGDLYSIEGVRESLQNLWALGTIADARVDVRQGMNGLEVVFTVEPRPRLHNVRFVGAPPWSRSRLRRALSAREGQPLDPATVRRQSSRLQQELSDDGYLLARVSAAVTTPTLPTQGILEMEIEPGMRAVLRQLELDGDLGLPEREIRAALGLQPGTPFRPAELEEALDRLSARLLDRHYFFHAVTVLEQSFDLQTGSVTLALRVEAGPAIALSFGGLDVAEGELHERLAIFEFGTVDDWALKESRQQIVTYLQERGHWRPLVSYSRDRDAEGRNIDVQFRVLAGTERGLHAIRFDGNPSIPASVLRAAIRTNTGGLLSSGRFISDWWAQDREAVVTVYRRSGFLQAEVIDAPVEIVDDQLVARMIVEEGIRTYVADLRIDVESSFPTPGIDLAAWRDTLEVRADRPHDPTAVRRDADRLRALLTNSGYPRAIVTSEVENLAPPTREGEVVETGQVPETPTVRVHQRIHPGERVRVGRVLITGNESTHTEAIERELRFVPGSPYSFADVLETQSRLYRTGLFDEVDVTAAEPDSLDTNRSMIVRVHEAPPLFINYGAGFDTEERLRGIFAIGHENVFGGNQEMNLSTRVSVREQRARLLYREPYLFGRRLETTATAFYSNEQEPSFDVQRWGGSINLLLRRRNNLDLIWRYSYRDVRTFNLQIDPRSIERQDRSTRVGSFGGALIYDTRPDPIDPREGTYQTLDIDVASKRLGSARNFVSVFGRSFWYFVVHDRLVLAAAARVGLELPFGSTVNVPLPERFFAGGASTLRGFPRDAAGPTDSLGNPLGGEALVIGNVEARVDVWGSLGAALFFDWGNVFAKPSDIGLAGMREILGVGGRYETPVGPVRLDLAWLLDRQPGEDTLQIFLSVGHTF